MPYHQIIDPWYRRLPRYLFIEDLVSGRRVLEFGCGKGVGSELLSKMGAAKVVGMDVDPNNVLHARTLYSRADIEFHQADPSRLSLPEDAFDLIIVPEAGLFVDLEGFLEGLSQGLTSQGLLYLSVPNGDIKAEEQGVGYYDLLARLEPLFKEVVTISQSMFLGFSLLEFVPRQSEPDLSLDDSLLTDSEDAGDYLALCSQSEVPLRAVSLVQIPLASAINHSAFGSRMAEPAGEPAIHDTIPGLFSKETVDRSELEEWQKRALTAEKKCEELTDRLQQARAEHEQPRRSAPSSAGDELDRLRRERRVLIEESDQVKAEAAQLKVRLKELDEVRELMSRRAESESDLKQKLAELQNQAEAGSLLLAQKDAEIIQLQSDIEKMRSDIIDQAEDAASRLERQEKRLTDELVSVRSRLEDTERAVELWSRKAEQLESDLLRENRRSDEVLASLAELAREKEHFENEVFALKAVVRQRDASNESLYRDLDREQKRNATLLVSIEELTQNLGKTKQELEDVSAQMLIADKDCARLRAELDSSGETLARQEGELTKRSWQLDELNTGLSALKKELTELTEKALSDEEEKKTLLEQLEEAINLVHSKETAVSELRRGALLHRQELARLEIRFNEQISWKEELSSRLAESAVEMEAGKQREALLEKKISRLHHELNDRSMSFATVQGELLRLEHMVDEAAGDLTRLEPSNAGDIASLSSGETSRDPQSVVHRLVSKLRGAMSDTLRAFHEEASLTARNLTQRLEDVGVQLRGATQRIKDQRDELEQNRHMIGLLNEQQQDKDRLIEKLREDGHGRKEEARALRKEIRQNQRELDDLRAALADRDEQLVRMEHELVRTAERLAELESQHKPKDDQIELLKSEIYNQKLHLEKLGEELETTRLERSRIAEALSAKESDREKAEEALAAAHERSSTLADRLNDTERNLVEATRRLKVITRRWEDAEAAAEVVRAKLTQSDQRCHKTEIEVGDQRERIKQLKKFLESETKKAEALQAKNDELAGQLQSFQEMEKESDRLRKEITELKKTIADLDLRREEMEFRTTALEHDSSELRQRLAAAKEEIAGFRDRHAELEKRLAAAKEEMAGYRDRHAELEKRLAEMSGSNESLESEIATLNSQREETSRLVAGLEQKLDAAQQEKNDALKRVENLEGKLSEFHRSSQTLSIELKGLTEERLNVEKAFEEEKSRLSDEMGELHRRIDLLDQELDRERWRSKELEQSLDAERTKALEAVSVAAERPKLDSPLLFDLQADKSEVERIETALILELEHSRRLLASAMELVEKAENAEEKRAEDTGVTDLLEEARLKITELTEELVEKEQRLGKIVSENTSHQEEIVQLRSELDRMRNLGEEHQTTPPQAPSPDWRAKETELIRRLKILELAVGEKDKSLRTHEKKVCELNMQLGDKDAEILLLYTSINDFKRRAEEIRNEVRRISEQLSTLEPEKIALFLQKVDSELARIRR